jgi:hypothetical protein
MKLSELAAILEDYQQQDDPLALWPGREQTIVDMFDYERVFVTNTEFEGRDSEISLEVEEVRTMCSLLGTVATYHMAIDKYCGCSGCIQNRQTYET